MINQLLSSWSSLCGRLDVTSLHGFWFWHGILEVCLVCRDSCVVVWCAGIAVWIHLIYNMCQDAAFSMLWGISASLSLYSCFILT
jgi:hypothetical protein